MHTNTSVMEYILLQEHMHVLISNKKHTPLHDLNTFEGKEKKQLFSIP